MPIGEDSSIYRSQPLQPVWPECSSCYCCVEHTDAFDIKPTRKEQDLHVIIQQENFHRKRSRTRVAHPVVERESAQLSSSMARDRNSHSSSSVKQGKESLGYVNIYLKEHSLRAHHDTEDRDRDRDRHGRSHSSSGNWNGNSNGNQQAFFSPTLLRRSVDPTRRGSGTGRGRGFSPDHSPSDSLSPSWLDDGDYRQGGSPGGVYTMPHFKRYHEQLGRARGRS
jgi:hypothetical protein